MKGEAEITGIIGNVRLVRTYSAGVWLGVVEQKNGKEVVLNSARRLWKWEAVSGISLSGVALFGINESGSRIEPPVDGVWVEAIELIPCSSEAIGSIMGARNATQ